MDNGLSIFKTGKYELKVTIMMEKKMETGFTILKAVRYGLNPIIKMEN